jgi:uncharacterized protein YabN with tetrapyrrole methylase and pyrophosphatase domain
MSSLQKLISLELKAEALGFECDEIRQSLTLKEGNDRLQEEVGDLLLSVLSLSVYERLDIEKIIADVANKFQGRLDALETIMKVRGYDSLKNQSFDIMLELWEEAKRFVDSKRL